MTQDENCEPRKILVSGISQYGYRLLLVSALICGSAHAQRQVLDTKMHNLRLGSTREWSDFPAHVRDSQLIIYFDVKDTVSSGSIELRQFEVKQIWEVLLNQTKLGQLNIDEKDMRTYLHIPKALLKKKDNKLVIRPGSAAPDVSDDVRVGMIFLHARSVNEILSETSLTVKVNDAETGLPLPSRVTITDTHGSLQPVIPVNDSMAVRTGVIYTGSGVAALKLPAGRYTIYGSRGFEYGVDSVMITSKPGDDIHKTLSVRHEVDTQGWIGCDPHIHSLTYSGHGDATLRERILTIAGEGIQLPVITEHNAAIDISDTVRAMGMNAWFTSVTGNEVTTKLGHFNLFPVTTTGKTTIDQVADWNELTRNIRATPSVKVVILNHAQDTHNGFRPFDLKHHIGIAGKSGLGWSFPANAMEVINSGSQQTDPRELYKNWMGMLNRGFTLTPVGSSDAHEVSRFLVGQSRTYIRGSKQHNAKIDMEEAISNFAAGKVTVSFGLLTEIIVDSLYGPGDLVPAAGPVQVSVRVMGPGWAQADHVSLYANGQKIRDIQFPQKKTGGLQWQGKWVLPNLAHDVFLVAVAEGRGTQRPFWPIARPYQHTLPIFNPMIMGLTGAVRIDADGDRRFTSAYHYAMALWDSCGKDVKTFIRSLAPYDRSVAIQAGAVMDEQGIRLTGPDMAKTLSLASVKVREGVLEYIKYWKMTDAYRE